MAHEVITLFAQYGLLLVFVSVFVDQAGAPVPSLPTLVVAGALAASGQLSLPGIFLVALVACVLGDLPWYDRGVCRADADASCGNEARKRRCACMNSLS